MAKYKVRLTVKDRYGCTKELDGGTIEINQDKLTDEDLNNIKESLPVYVPDVTAENQLIYTLERGETQERLEFDIDRSNDWNEMGNATSAAGFVWESM